jgi:hypothetical protein
VSRLPIVTSARIDTESLTSAAVDAAVRDALADGRSLYAVDADLIAQLAPDLILAQDLRCCSKPAPALPRARRRDRPRIAPDGAPALGAMIPRCGDARSHRGKPWHNGTRPRPSTSSRTVSAKRRQDSRCGREIRVEVDGHVAG